MRCYLPILCLAFVLGHAPLAGAQNDVIKNNSVSTELGKNVVVGVHTNFHRDCTPAAMPQIRINNQPKHGVVFTTPGPYDTSEASRRSAVGKCREKLGKTVPGMHLVYKPNPGFIGVDTVGYTVFFTRRSDEHRVTVTVHRQLALAPSSEPKPERVPAAEAATAPQTAVRRGEAPAPTAAAKAERRVALVIGNSAYKAVPQLPNPRRDAEAVAAALRGAGFQSVKFESDLTRNDLVEALRGFAREAETADWAVVYFAGHGIEVGGVNYLVPVDARLESDRDVQFDAVALDQVLGAVEGTKGLRLIILDACRENPFVPRMRKTVASRSIGRGLASVEPSSGTLVVYAARDGQLAMDGDGANSPFVAALLKNLESPGVEIGLLFRRVRDDVLSMTGRRQEPFTYGSLPSEAFYFRAPVAAK